MRGKSNVHVFEFQEIPVPPHSPEKQFLAINMIQRHYHYISTLVKNTFNLYISLSPFKEWNDYLQKLKVISNTQACLNINPVVLIQL